MTLGFHYRRLTKKTLAAATTAIVKSTIMMLEEFSLLSLVVINSTLLDATLQKPSHSDVVTM